jgi:hypothetical protein
MKPQYTYSIQCKYLDKWNSFILDTSLQYCRGYMDALEGQQPRNSLRLIRSDGKVIREISEYDDVSIGMIAGWPTAEQYERAAERALERARKIRENKNETSYP